MPTNSLLVPIVLPGSDIQFASVNQDATAHDVISELLRLDKVKRDILGDLSDSGWALQKFRLKDNNPSYEDGELSSLEDGIIPRDASVVPFLPTSKQPPTQRHFSLFPTTGHLHSATMRLVSLHPLLRIHLSFLRVPNIHDNFEYTFYISRTMTVDDLVKSIVQELGLSLSAPATGKIDYEIEQSSHTKEKSSLSHDSVVFDVLSADPSPDRSFTFCVPEGWYLRPNPRSRNISGVSIEPSEATLRQLADLQESDEDDEDEGTAKGPSSSNQPASPDWRKSYRISNIFEWLPQRNSVVLPPSSADNRKSVVSEPLSVEHHTGNGLKTSFSETTVDEESDLDEAGFEEMLNDLGLKDSKREDMYNLSNEQKRYLMRQNRGFKSAAKSPHRPPYASYGPSTGSGIIPRLMPQLTGDALMKRFSLWGGDAVSATNDPHSASSTRSHTQISPVQEEIQPLQPQTTGGLWSSFWASSGGEKKSKEVTVKSSLDSLRNGRTSDARLTKHLISLRVQFSTSPLAWSHQFIEENGLEVLESLLIGLVAKGGKKRVLTEVETNNLFEIVKCIRHVLNTEIGFQRALSSPTLITNITYALHTPSPKLRAFVGELLAAVCMISVTSGHKAVLAAFSDYRIEFDEAFRFETLLVSLRLPDMASDGEASDDEFGFGAEEESVWAMRASSMALVNALTMCPDSTEDRVFLRDEFSRRGLNEIIVALRYLQPPESLKIQLNVYTEEKLDDETEMRSRATNQVLRDSGHDRSRSDSEAALEDIILLAKQHGELYPMMMEILNHYAAILQRDINVQLKGDLLKILDKIVEQAALLDKFDDNWHGFMKRFATSVKEVTGQEFEVRVPSEDSSMVVVEQELEALRTKVEELSDERTELRNELNSQIAEINALKSLPLNLPGPQGKTAGKGGENFHGLVQRLVAKEKQVLVLQTELDRLKAQNPSEGRDADERAKRDRDRNKWNTLMDEIAKLKTKNDDLEQMLNIKDKDILYLKRAMESVYTRFISREETREEMRVANMDAELMATKSIESLARKDDEIASLVIEVAELKAKLAAKPMTEKEFKMRSPPPPPPPPVKPKRPDSPVKTSDSPRSPPPIAPPLPSSTSTVSLPSTPRQDVVPIANPVLSPTTISGPPVPPPPPPPPPMPGNRVPIPPPPPPPMRGNSSNSVPVPPPPPSSYRPPAPSMPAIRPGRKLKPFFWDKLTDTSQSVWSEATFDFTLDLNDLEATFAIDKASTQPKSPSARRETQTHTLLPGTRATNIGVLLSRIKIGPIEIRKALVELDDVKLSVDDLKGISKQLPTTEEVASYKSFGDDVSGLSRADQFCYQMMSIPRLHERVSCMVYRRKLDMDIAEIRPDLDFLRSAALELRRSTKFKQILQSILMVGNALNGSTFRGGARGFQLDALLKMRETKTSLPGTDCPTLMHYLARVLLRSDPNMLRFIEDMPHLEAAGRVSVQTVMQSVTSMVQGLTQVKNEITAVKSLRTLPANDQFVQIMQPFVDEVEPRVNALRSMSAVVDQELRGLLTYYGEKPDSPEAPKLEDFFGMILSFSSSLQKCALEIADKMEMKKPGPPTIEIPSEVSQTIKAQDVPLSQFTPDSYGRSIGRGDLDQAIRSMRDGKRRARPQNTRPLSKIFVDGGGARQSRVFN